ncbi:MAG: DUF5682 family protein [Pseudomonadota bacterium]
MADSTVHYFGIRHHGPGCARSLRAALTVLQPDCLLIEGPPDADALLPYVTHAGLCPPVALLVHSPDDTHASAFYPFAEFSPEWQALQHGVLRGIPTRFIDLPQAVRLAQDKIYREKDNATEKIADDTDATRASDEKSLEVSEETVFPQHHDPMDALAHAAGFADGESWWNHIVEERGDSEDLFAAIHEAMAALREEWPDDARGPRAAEREMQREAHMRQCVREAVGQGHARIAVVCGAWHVPALQAKHTAKADAALLKGLPKIKVSATWVPWTYRHLTWASGYGAGVDSPGWYDYLWQRSQSGGDVGASRASGWLARVARLLRAHQLDCSSAHVIEASRLSDTLAALRGRAEPGLEELNEAVRTVICMGASAPLELIHRALTVSDRMGQVPPEVPAVPLQRDIEQAQKSLRLKPEALERTLDLDLRNANDLARSHLLHRLRLLGIRWGEPARSDRANRGTFRETWRLQWQPEFALRIIEATRFGPTVELAANACVAEQCASLTRLDALAELVDTVLLADLGTAVQAVSHALQTQAAITGDAVQLISAVPPLARVFRYGSVRQMDGDLLAKILDGLITRGAIGLPLACHSLDDSAAETLRDTLLPAHDAVGLRDSAEPSQAWQQALQQIAVGDACHALLRGLCCRLLLDAGHIDQAQAAVQLSRNLSAGALPLEAAQWLDGFLNRNAMVLLHDAAVWSLVDAWLAELVDAHFLQVVPLLRRSFSNFSQSERRELGARAAHGVKVTPVVAASEGDAVRAALPVPTLRLLLGLPV